MRHYKAHENQKALLFFHWNCFVLEATYYKTRNIIHKYTHTSIQKEERQRMNIFTETSRLVFEHTTGHHSLAKLINKMNYHMPL